jgi:hypothetical protein
MVEKHMDKHQFMGPWAKEIAETNRRLALGEALRTVLRARGFTIDEATTSRIAHCKDAALLDRWIARGATAKELSEVFG